MEKIDTITLLMAYIYLDIIETVAIRLVQLIKETENMWWPLRKSKKSGLYNIWRFECILHYKSLGIDARHIFPYLKAFWALK